MLTAWLRKGRDDKATCDDGATSHPATPMEQESPADAKKRGQKRPYFKTSSESSSSTMQSDPAPQKPSAGQNLRSLSNAPQGHLGKRRRMDDVPAHKPTCDGKSTSFMIMDGPQMSDSAGPAVDSATPTAVPAARDKELSAATEAAMDGPEDETDVAQEVVLEEDVKSQHCVNLTHCQCAVASYNSGAGQRELSSLHIARRAGPPSLSTATSIPGDIVLVRCTSTEHKSEYRLERNIAKVFARFRSEGKATIRLKSPQLDVVVSNANPEELEKFLDTLFIVHTKPGTLPPLPGTAMLLLQPFTKEKLAFENQKKMKVGSDRDLPDAYPPSLQSLKLNGHGLRAIPRKVLALRRLTALDLSHNALVDVEDALAKLPALVSVNLSHNNLHEVPTALLTASLRRLDLSHNAITALPRRIYKWTGLETLILCHNQLKAIPPFISHLKGLRELKVSNNRLRCLPAEICKFQRVRLQNLDLSGNPFDASPTPDLDELKFQFTVASLRELAARATLNSRRSIDKTVLPPLVKRYLKHAGRCSCCGGAFFQQSAVYTKTFDAAMLSEGMVHIPGGNSVPLEHQVCSKLCLLSKNSQRRRVELKVASGSTKVVGSVQMNTKYGPMRRHAASKARTGVPR